MNAPTSTAFATVPRPTRAPSDHASSITATATTMFASPNESGVCLAIPWLSTSHGESPSRDSRMSTIPNANTARPKRRLANRAARPPRTWGALLIASE